MRSPGKRIGHDDLYKILIRATAGVNIMKQTKNPSFLQSRMFRTLFVTYVLIIVVFVSIYAVSYVSMCQDNLRSAVRQSSEQEAYTWALYADQQLLSAQSMCNALNASENCRAILQSNYV